MAAWWIPAGVLTLCAALGGASVWAWTRLRDARRSRRAAQEAGGFAHWIEQAGGGRCPRCAREYGPGFRYCPVDAAELERALEISGHDRPAPWVGTGKICPMCTCAYASAARYCGKDGVALVNLN